MTSPIREYDLSARSTDVVGRILCQARNHVFIVDGPIQNNCPGEALTPPELMLAAVLTCGVELVEVIARDTGVKIGPLHATIHGHLDRSKQAHEDVTLFNTIRMDFTFTGTDQASAETLVAGFRRRCPIFGTVFVATPEVIVNVRVA